MDDDDWREEKIGLTGEHKGHVLMVNQWDEVFCETCNRWLGWHEEEEVWLGLPKY